MSQQYDDLYPTCDATYATFRVALPHGTNVAVVSEVLRLTPTRSHRRGEDSSRPGSWLLSSKGSVDSRDLRHHLDWLLDQLESAADGLAELRAQGLIMDVGCFWRSARGHGGPTISQTEMGRLSTLGLDLWIDFYSGPAGTLPTTSTES